MPSSVPPTSQSSAGSAAIRTETVDLGGTGVVGASPGLSGLLARPAGEGPWPALVVIFEAFGMDDVMRRHLVRLAEAGYLALMPDLYNGRSAKRCLVPMLRALASGKGTTFTDIEVARQWLLASPECTGRVGSIGFCMGGGFALATANRGFEAASANYGMLPRDLDAAMAGACPVVASYPGQDRMMRGEAARLEASLEKFGVPHDVKEYPDAGHSFLNDGPAGPGFMQPLMRVMGIGPEPAAAADAWVRIETFLDEHLKSGD